MSITTPAGTQVDTEIIRLQGGGLRFLDAYEMRRRDFQVVTRQFQRFHGVDATQLWRVTEQSGGFATIQQVSSSRFLDAHEVAELDFRVVTRSLRDSDTQRWLIEDLGGGFATIQQVSSGRFLEATVHGDFTVVTRVAGSSEQTWRIRAA